MNLSIGKERNLARDAEEAAAKPAPQSLFSNLSTGGIQTTLSYKREGEGSAVSILLLCEMHQDQLLVERKFISLLCACAFVT